MLSLRGQLNHHSHDNTPDLSALGWLWSYGSINQEKGNVEKYVEEASEATILTNDRKI
jgi:hypothetical protein